MDCPCKDCERKGCGPYHDKCESYLKFVAERQKEREEKAKRSKERYEK